MNPNDKTVALVHAVIPAMESTRHYLSSIPGVTLVNILDEALLPEAERRGGVDDACVERMATLIGLAQEAGASAVVVTCNAYSGAVDQLAGRFDPTWVVSIDQVLVDTAIAQGTRIGVVGTVAVGLKQQAELFTSRAARLGKDIELVPRLVDQAFDALRHGDAERHHTLVVDAVRDMADVDLIVLAQASMAPALDRIRPEDSHGVRVLASPQLMAAELRAWAGPDR